MATKPVTWRALRAALTAFAQSAICAKRRLPWAEARLDTTFPRRFFVSASRRRPPTVFSFEPRSTRARAKRPLAILLTRFAFITFRPPFLATVPAVRFIARAMTIEELRKRHGARI